MSLDRLISLSANPSDMIEEEERDVQVSNKLNVQYLKDMQKEIISSELKVGVVYNPVVETIQDLQPGQLPPISAFYKKVVYRIIPHKIFQSLIKR
jgi:hypothetical protein